MIRTSIVLFLLFASAALAGETIIIPETASTLFTSQALTASTAVTSSSTYTLERTRDVTLEYKLSGAPNNLDTVYFLPLYTGNSAGNGTGYALPLYPTDGITLSMGQPASGFVKFTPPPGVYSMTVQATASYGCTLDVTARGK